MKGSNLVTRAPADIGTQSASRVKIVITDVDGTLASFWDYFLPAIRDFLREISARLDTPVSDLAQDIGHIIDRRGTHEYPWLLEETSFAWKSFADKPDEFIEDFARPFWEALDSNREKYLRPFPKVLETFEELKRKGIKIVALSDAPDYMARIRNKQIFDGMLDAVYALQTVEPGEQDIYQPISLKNGRARVRSLHARASALKSQFISLPQTYEKPCPAGLDQILKDFDIFPQEAVYIGDSLSKDGLVAASRGMRFVWAHYGEQLPAEYEEIARFSLRPKGIEKTARQLPATLVAAVAARYDELLNHI